MKLEHAFTYRKSIVEPHLVSNGPAGQRRCYEKVDGLVTGPQLSARTIGSGADWMTVTPDGLMRMDVRIQLRTDDGAWVNEAVFVGEARASPAGPGRTGFEHRVYRLA